MKGKPSNHSCFLLQQKEQLAHETRALTLQRSFLPAPEPTGAEQCPPGNMAGGAWNISGRISPACLTGSCTPVSISGKTDSGTAGIINIGRIKTLAEVPPDLQLPDKQAADRIQHCQNHHAHIGKDSQIHIGNSESTQYQTGKLHSHSHDDVLINDSQALS